MEKAFDKIQYPFLIKNLESLETQGSYLNLVKAAYRKPIAHINLNMEKLKVKNYRPRDEILIIE